ncbi:MAG: cadherin-like beta sandwich domain-containing protein, partial [Chloroflexi bacterium]|nr:cadherin-like beta sandwich domain-containing protein [Chloroflexota bacterium]
MMRASSLLRLSPLLLLTAVLVAATVLFSGGAPAEAQAPATVTRWVGVDATGSNAKIRFPVEVRAGNYYKVLVVNTRENRVAQTGSVYEGDLVEVVMVGGAESGYPDFTCTTYDGTANDVDDYVTSGTNGFPVQGSSFTAGTDYTVNLPVTTRVEQDKSANVKNISEPTEYFEVECLPTGTGANLWRADGQGSARARIEIIDAEVDARLNGLGVKTSTDGTNFSSSSLTLSPALSVNNDHTEFSASVGGSVTHVRVEPSLVSFEATITVNGVAVENDATTDIALSEIPTTDTINIQVTGSDGTTTRDY